MNETLNSPFEVRVAQPDDVETIAEFTRSIAWETENVRLDPEVVLKGVQEGLRDPALGFYVVAETSDSIVGCLMVTYEWSDWRNGVQWWLQSVYVRSDFRGKGVFRQLWDFTFDLATKKPGVCGIRLYVEKDNESAQSVYKSVGMKDTDYRVYEIALTNT